MRLPYVYLPVRALWIWAVVIATVFLLPFVWYVSHITFAAFQSVGSQLITDLGTNNTQSDQVEAFLDYADRYILVLALIGIGLFAWVYSQKRGVPVYEPY